MSLVLSDDPFPRASIRVIVQTTKALVPERSRGRKEREMAEIKITIHLDRSGIDAAIKKAERINVLVAEVQKLALELASDGIQVPYTIGEPTPITTEPTVAGGEEVKDT